MVILAGRVPPAICSSTFHKYHNCLGRLVQWPSTSPLWKFIKKFSVGLLAPKVHLIKLGISSQHIYSCWYIFRSPLLLVFTFLCCVDTRQASIAGFQKLSITRNWPPRWSSSTQPSWESQAARGWFRNPLSQSLVLIIVHWKDRQIRALSSNMLVSLWASVGIVLSFSPQK